jgi:hypothetical protein
MADRNPPPTDLEVDHCWPLLNRIGSRWPGLLLRATKDAADAEARKRLLCAPWTEALKQAGAIDLAPAWPADEEPSQQVDRVLSAFFQGWFDGHEPADVARQTAPGIKGDRKLQLALRAEYIRHAAQALRRDPQHPPVAPPGAVPQVRLGLLVRSTVAQGGLRAELELQAVHAPGAALLFVPAPASALTFCTQRFADALSTVTTLLRHLLPSTGPTADLALQWNLYTPEHVMTSLDGPSAGAAFAVAALWLLQQHLPDGPVRQQLAGIMADHLHAVGISLAIDDAGQCSGVGATQSKALAYDDTARPSGPRHLFMHPEDVAQLDTHALPGVQLHPATSLLGLLTGLRAVSVPQPAFRAVLDLMPLHRPAEADDDQPPPTPEDRQRHDSAFRGVEPHQHQVLNLRDYCIARWAYWARQARGELYMLYVPLSLQPAEGSGGAAPRLSPEVRPGLAALLADMHDSSTGRDLAEALLLRGTAGAGKSTLLQRHEQALALDFLRRHDPVAAGDARPLEVPLYVTLSSLTADVSDPVEWLQTRLRKEYPACEPLHQLLQGQAPAGHRPVRLRLLLDGLNELQVGPRQTAVDRAAFVVDRLCQRLTALAPLLSARGQHGFERLPQVQRGACVQVQPWSADLVLRYVERCFSERTPDGRVQVRAEGQALARALQQPENRAVADLCRTPFNAAGQVALWAAGHRQLVQHRADLYRRLLHQMLRREVLGQAIAERPPNPLFRDLALLTDDDVDMLVDDELWAQTPLPPWPQGGQLLRSLFRQALAQWLGADRPAHERGTVELLWNDPADRALAPGTSAGQRSVAWWLRDPLAARPDELRSRWRQAVRDLGLLADEGDGTRFRFRHQSWGEYLASVDLLAPTPAGQVEPSLDTLGQHLRHRAFDRDRDALAELQHQRRQADALWWNGAPGRAWWQQLLNEPLEVPLSRLKAGLNAANFANFAAPDALPRPRWTFWQRRVRDKSFEVDEASDRIRISLARWGDAVDVAGRYGVTDDPWQDQPSCVRALVLGTVWLPVEAEIRKRVVVQLDSRQAQALWRATGRLGLRDVGALDEVLGLALLGLDNPDPWLRWLLDEDLWPALQPLLADLQRTLEDGSEAVYGPGRPHPVLQHLRRVLLLRSLDAGPASRDPIERSGQWACLSSRDDQCDPALQAHWQRERQAAFQTGRDLRERLQAAYMLGVLGDNLRYERAPAATGMGLRIKPELWAGVGDPSRPTKHRIGSEPGTGEYADE